MSSIGRPLPTSALQHDRTALPATVSVPALGAQGSYRRFTHERQQRRLFSAAAATKQAPLVSESEGHHRTHTHSTSVPIGWSCVTVPWSDQLSLRGVAPLFLIILGDPNAGQSVSMETPLETPSFIARASAASRGCSHETLKPKQGSNSPKKMFFQ